MGTEAQICTYNKSFFLGTPFAPSPSFLLVRLQYKENMLIGDIIKVIYTFTELLNSINVYSNAYIFIHSLGSLVNL